MMLVLFAGIIDGRIAGTTDATCGNTVCNLSNDNSYLWSNLHNVPTGFADNVDDVGAGVTPGDNVNLTYLNVSGTVILSGYSNCALNTNSTGELICGSHTSSGGNTTDEIRSAVNSSTVFFLEQLLSHDWSNASAWLTSLAGLWDKNNMTTAYSNLDTDKTDDYNEDNFSDNFYDMTCDDLTDCVTNAYYRISDLSQNNVNDYYCKYNQSGDILQCDVVPVSLLGYFNDIGNFTGSLTDTKLCAYSGDSGWIDCDTDQVTDTNRTDQDIINVVNSSGRYYNVSVPCELISGSPDTDFCTDATGSGGNCSAANECNAIIYSGNTTWVTSNQLTYSQLGGYTDSNSSSFYTTSGAWQTANSTANIVSYNGTYGASDLSCTDCISGAEISELSDADVSDTLTASDLVTGSSVVSDTEVDDDITISSSGSVDSQAVSLTVNWNITSYNQTDDHGTFMYWNGSCRILPTPSGGHLALC